MNECAGKVAHDHNRVGLTRRACPMCRCEGCGGRPVNGKLKLLQPDDLWVCVKCYMDAHNSNEWKPLVHAYPSMQASV